jgi:hypothetical protein
MDSEIDVLKLKSSLQLLGTKIEGAQGTVKEILKKLKV